MIYEITKDIKDILQEQCLMSKLINGEFYKTKLEYSCYSLSHTSIESISFYRGRIDIRKDTINIKLKINECDYSKMVELLQDIDTNQWLMANTTSEVGNLICEISIIRLNDNKIIEGIRKIASTFI